MSKIPSIAFSKEVDINDFSWLESHNGDFRDELIEYPGILMEKIIKLFLKEISIWRGLWNVNFPVESTDKIKFTVNYSNNYFPNRVKIEPERYSYINESNVQDIQPDSDVRALLDNFASITPVRWQLTDDTELERLRKISL